MARTRWLPLVALWLCPVVACAMEGASSVDDLSATELERTLTALDSQLFDAYNRCDLAAFRSMLADDLEFYHDQGGVMRSPDTLTEAVKQNICGKVRRELVPGTLEVDRIAGFGGIEMGNHRFCELDSGHCVGIARFLHIWKYEHGVWRVSRIISYGHRPLTDPAAAQ
ncbi:MAG: nuclear transport factor 2 family protein [Xanthomonadaceae bacterium]|nr:nuclear transport factor 2 family protein [Xanthomonadaceae bacterium]